VGASSETRDGAVAVAARVTACRRRRRSGVAEVIWRQARLLLHRTDKIG
jgi:hypothetical protein